MRIISLFIFALFISLDASSQCNPDLNSCFEMIIPYTDGSEERVKYCGELNDRGERNGCGILYYLGESIIYSSSGLWKNGLLNGYAEKTFKDGSIFKGNFEKGILKSGSYLFEKDGISTTYNGGFNGPYFQGKGYWTIQGKDKIITRDGKFIRDQFVDGVEEIKYKSNGIIQISDYADGIATIIFRNDRNQQNEDDIEGDVEFTEVNLIQRGDIYDARIAFDIKLEISGVEGEFLLDTGAMSFTIGRLMYNRLKKEGIKYYDLNKIVQSFGIGGDSYSKLVILDEVKIGDYIVKNVVASVSLDNDYSLVGTGFFLKFSDVIWKMNEKKLILYK
jgi:clan AA aspartic protease (TIGR02281 family)